MSKPGAYTVYLVMEGISSLLRSMIYIVVAVYYVQAVGLDPLQLVLVGTILEATAVLFQVPTGVLADTYSRRLAIVAGTALVGVCFVLEGVVPLFPAILLAEIIRGVGESSIDGATGAWVADELGEAELPRALLRGGQVGQIGGLAGTAAGVALASVRLNLPVALGGALLIGLALFLALSMPERGFRPTRWAGRTRRQAIGAMGETLREGVRAVRRVPILPTLLAVAVFTGSASEGFDRLWEAHLLRDIAFPPLGGLKPVVWFGIIGVGTTVACVGALHVAGTRLQAAARDPDATARALLMLGAIAIAGAVAFGLAPGFGLAAGALLVKAVAGSLSRPLYNTWLIQNIDPRVRATVLSLQSGGDALGQMAGGPVIGAVGTVLSLRAAIAATGLLLAPVLALYARTLRHTRAATPMEAPAATLDP